jgi:hypothetical protein
MPFEIKNKAYSDTTISFVGAGTYTIPLANLGVDITETISSADIKTLIWSSNNIITIKRNYVTVGQLFGSGNLKLDEIPHSIANNKTGNIQVTINGSGSLIMQLSKVVGEPAEPTEEPEDPPVTSGSIFIPGTSSRVTLTPGIVVGGTSTTPFTVEGWFYSTVTPGTNSGPVLLSTDTGSGTPSYAKALTINISTTTQIVVDSNGAAQQAFNFAETMLVNTWYYVAVSRDSSGNLQVWLGKDGDANATASTTGRQPLNTTAWELTGLSNTIGAFVPAGRYTTGYISNLRVDSTGLYATDAATIPMPTEPFAELAGTVFLQNTDELTDETGTQTLTAVGTAAGNALNPF